MLFSYDLILKEKKRQKYIFENNGKYISIKEVCFNNFDFDIQDVPF